MTIHPIFSGIIGAWQLAPSQSQLTQTATDTSLKDKAIPDGTGLAKRQGMKTEPWRDRAPKEVPTARCCWVCGKLGGSGFTHSLLWAGYRLGPREMGYAHNKCMDRANRQHMKHLAALTAGKQEDST